MLSSMATTQKVLENANRPMPMCVSNPSLRSFDDDDDDMPRSESVFDGCFTSSYELYIFNYTRSLEQTYYQLSSIRPLHYRLSSFIRSPISNKGEELIGCIFDLIRIDNPDIARAVSIRRQVAMKTVVVRSGRQFMEFRRKEQNARPMSFLPLDMAFDSIAPGPEDLPLKIGVHDGFRGYAIDLIDLRPEHQYLRMSVCWALFKDLAIFTDLDSARRAAKQCGQEKLFYATIKEAKALPSPPILIQSKGFLPRTGDYNHQLLLERAKIRLSRGLIMLSKNERKRQLDFANQKLKSPA